MSGASCEILLPRPRTEADRAILDLLMTKVGNIREAESSFWVATTKLIGGSYRGEPRPFVAGFHSYDDDPDPAEIELISDTFGFIPSGVLAIGAMCNDAVDQLLLAEVAAWLAEKLGGVIDASGPLALPLDNPGRHIEVPYTIWDGLKATYHVLDATALRAWCRNPHFHMIK